MHGQKAGKRGSFLGLGVRGLLNEDRDEAAYLRLTLCPGQQGRRCGEGSFNDWEQEVQAFARGRT